MKTNTNPKRVKKMAYILMILVMLIGGATPTVGMHYCGADWYALTLSTHLEADEADCCSATHQPTFADRGDENIGDACCTVVSNQLILDDYLTGVDERACTSICTCKLLLPQAVGLFTYQPNPMLWNWQPHAKNIPDNWKIVIPKPDILKLICILRI